jgi:hypothetical protein
MTTMIMAACGLKFSFCLEPISKSLEDDNEAGELNKAQEILGIVLPADEDSSAATGSRQRKRASGAYSGLDGVDLV